MVDKKLDEGKAYLAALQKKYLEEEQKYLDGFTKEQRIALGHPIKNISKLDTFQANGVTYIVRTSLTLGRFEEFEKLQIDVGYGASFQEVFKNIRKAYDYLNEGVPMDAGVILYNVMNGIKKNLQDRKNPILQLCALFIVTEDEDLTTFDPVLTNKKLADWKAEGIEAQDFFSFAFNLVQGFTTALDEVSQGISAKTKQAKGNGKQKKNAKRN